ncbi:helix-turn-helix domain-containing protein [Paenibacillus validus]|uniref:Helix-turn-helix domain-containing protein n=1 Tax=Paenibacillus validus TaxID=44253 RepID=A0A7X2ZEM5_9BACL|nr:helix-turn-helix domain-containing protein [Paenibacillus validus]
MFDNDDKYIVPSVKQAVEILHLLSRTQHQNKKFGEIMDILNIPRTTTMRLLRTLISYGLVYYDERSQTYSLGPYLVILGARATEFLDYLGIVRKHLSQIQQVTGLTSVAAQRIRRDRLTYLVKEESRNFVHVTVSLGQQFPIDRGSFGKVFCAYLEDEELKEVASSRYNEPFIAELKEIRKLGYATSKGEQVDGISGVAAPIFGPDGQVFLAISCIGVMEQLPSSKMIEYGELLRDKGIRITQEIGGVVPKYVNS